LTTGYEQWEPHLFTVNISDGLAGFLLDPRKSIFVYFPLLLFSIPGAWSFAMKYRFDFSFAAVVFGLFYIVNSAFINWHGDWCYGPRYLLFVLPVLCLPCLEVVRFCWGKVGWRWLAPAAAATLMIWTCRTQLYVHGVEFFAPFRAEVQFSTIADPRLANYFRKPYWQINRDLLNFQAGSRPFPALELARERLSAEQYLAIEQSLRRLPLINAYWIMSVPKGQPSKPALVQQHS
jgi:hypothetical protein